MTTPSIGDPDESPDTSGAPTPEPPLLANHLRTTVHDGLFTFHFGFQEVEGGPIAKIGRPVVVTNQIFADLTGFFSQVNARTSAQQ